MRTSEFWALMEQHYGRGYARVVAETQVLGSLGGRTPEAALAEGEPARRVWEAICHDLHVPVEHHWLADRKPRD